MSPMNRSVFRLITFGTLSLETDEGPVRGLAGQRKRLAFLALLAGGSDRGLSRDKLLAYLWPESDAAQGRNSLSQLLYGLRRELGVDAIVGDGELRLNPQIVDSDIARFMDAVDNGRLEEVAGCYTGPFLDGIYLRGLSEFERWVEEQRTRLTSTYERALETLAKDASRANAFGDAAKWWRRLAIADPLSARVAIAYARSLVDGGDRSAALNHLAGHAALVRSELGVEPDPCVAELEAALRTNSPIKSTQPLEARITPPILTASDRSSRSIPRYRTIVTATLSIAAVVAILVAPNRFSSTTQDQRTVLVIPIQPDWRDTLTSRVSRVAVDQVVSGIAASGLARVTRAEDGGLAPGAGGNGGTRTESEALALARRRHARHAFLTTVEREGDSLAVYGRLMDVPGGTVERVVLPIRGHIHDVEETVSVLRQRAAGAVATALDLRVASIESPGTPAPTFDAYSAFAHGLSEFESDRYIEATELFEKSYRSDTTFLSPIVWAVFSTKNSGNAAKGDTLLALLATRRERLGIADQFGLQYLLGQPRADEAANLSSLRQAAAAAPGSEWSFLLAGRALRAGNIAEAVKAIDAVDRLNGWARGWQGYWRTAADVHHAAGETERHLQLVREARIVFPRLPILAFQEISGLATLHRRRELMEALPRYLAVDWGHTIWGPAQLFSGLMSSADSSEKREIAEQCVHWFETHGATTGLDWTYTSQRFARCLYSAGKLERAEALATQLADSFAHVVRDTTPRALQPRNVIVARANFIETWGLLGAIFALRGKRAEAERVLVLLPTLPTPSPELQGYYYEHAALIAASLEHREQAIDLALRARQNGDLARAGRQFTSRLDPLLARYRGDTAVLAAFGIVKQ
jgi:DNA-binding SARP family transcriptional activator